MLTKRRKARHRFFSERNIVREQEIRIRLGGRTPDATFQLVHLSQSQALRVFNDERVGVGVVDARFDDSGSHQYIKFASREVFHNVFQLLFSHLAMGNANTRLTCGGLHALHRLIDGAYAIAYVVDLPATGHLSAYGIAHHVGIPLANMHFHRAPVVGRS